MAQSTLATPLKLSHSLTTTIPKLVYGTAWKKLRTAELVYQALKAGFRGIDTAAQPRHYQENLVGDGIRRAIKEGLVTRDELYVSYTPFNAPPILQYTILTLSDPNKVYTHLWPRHRKYAI